MRGTRRRFRASSRHQHIGLLVGRCADQRDFGVDLGTAHHDRALGIEKLSRQATLDRSHVRELARVAAKLCLSLPDRLHEADLCSAQRCEELLDLDSVLARGGALAGKLLDVVKPRGGLHGRKG